MNERGYRPPYRTMTEDDGRVVLLDGEGFHIATLEDMEHVGEHVGDTIASALNLVCQIIPPQTQKREYDDDRAKREGWALFLCDDGKLRIQRLDDPQSCGDDFPAEPIFANDEEAILHVASEAVRGSLMHKAALDLHLTDDHKPEKGFA